MQVEPAGATIPGVTHHRVEINGTALHYVEAGTAGSPILLVHGFPETWWAFHKLIPLLTGRHRVYAVDLRGFGDSDIDSASHGSEVAAEDLRALVASLDVGPVHLVGQDISGATVFRLATTHPSSVQSLTAVEMGLAGFGLEMLADVTSGGTWHIGLLAAAGIPEMLLTGREREFLGDFAFRTMTKVDGAVTEADLAEFVRSYSRQGGWRGASGLYRSMLREGPELRSIAAEVNLSVPVLAVDAAGGSFTVDTMSQVASSGVSAVTIDGVGHYVALEAPEQLATALLNFAAVADEANTT